MNLRMSSRGAGPSPSPKRPQRQPSTWSKQSFSPSPSTRPPKKPDTQEQSRLPTPKGPVQRVGESAYLTDPQALLTLQGQVSPLGMLVHPPGKCRATREVPVSGGGAVIRWQDRESSVATPIAFLG